VHQPTDDKLPGLSLAIFGQYFNRHESWAEMARPWIDYIARSSFLLQQGTNVADVAYFHGEEAPLTALYAHAPLADVPVRHAYDFVDAAALAGTLSVDHGDLVSPAGARYRALYLGGTTQRMTLATLRRIATLVEQGATVIGAAPTGSPALGDDRAAYAALVARLWRRTYDKPVPNSDVQFAHRRLADGDVYFLVNRHDRTERIDARFRVTGKVPELWHAETGLVTPVTYRIVDGETIVPLDLSGEDAVFVVFRRDASGAPGAAPTPATAAIATIAGPWTVAFQAGRGAPAVAILPTLAPLDRSTVPGIRYFSGIATYSSSFTLPTAIDPGKPMTLDLGQVGDLAEVRVNGRMVGTVWHAPYRLDISAATRRGTNRIEVRVANVWANRLIGDAQPGAKPITWTAMPSYKPDAPRRPAGLIGPVTIKAWR
jgi:hypothetical protein